MTVVTNPINANQEGLIYLSSGGLPTGVDGSTAGFVCTSNGTGIAPSFQSAAASSISIRPYIVGPTNSDFTTIPAAITQAVTDGAGAANPKIIFIKPNNGTPYAGGFSLPLGVSLVGINLEPININPEVSPVVIDGQITINVAGQSSINNIQLTNSSGDAISLVAGYLLLNNCTSNVGTGNYLINSSLSTAGAVTITNCLFDCAGALITHSGSATCTLVINTSNLVCLEPSDCTNVSGGFDIRFDYTYFGPCPFIFNAATSGFVEFCEFAGAADFITNTAGGTITLGQNNVNFFAAQIFNNANTVVSGVGALFARQSFPTYTYGNGATIQSSYQVSANDCVKWNSARTGFLGSECFESQGFLTTGNATQSILFSIGVNQLETITLRGTIAASDAAHTDSCGGDFLITARRATGGNVTLVGLAVTNVNTDTAATFTAAVNVGTQTVDVLVTGLAMTNYNWVSTYSYHKVLDSN